MTNKHTPNEMTVSGLSLWSDTPVHSHVRMVDVVKHSAFNGLDSQYITNELAKRWNCHKDLLEALEALINKNDDLCTYEVSKLKLSAQKAIAKAKAGAS
jgi:hypothetical protein